jgi:hypothetical protein
MKCLKSTKTGNIIRVDDKQAYQMAGREWQYVPKSEWKALRPAVTQKQVEEIEKKEETISKKAFKRQKLGEKQREASDLDYRLMEK